MVLVGDAFEDSVVDQVVQALGENVAGDTQAGLEVIEAPYAEESIPDDEQAPPLPNDIQALGDRAGDVLEACPLHKLSIEGCVIERTNPRLSSMKKLTRPAAPGVANGATPVTKDDGARQVDVTDASAPSGVTGGAMPAAATALSALAAVTDGSASAAVTGGAMPAAVTGGAMPAAVTDGAMPAAATDGSAVAAVTDGSASVATPVRRRDVTWEDPLVGAALALDLSGLDYLRAIAEGRIPAPPVAELLGMGIVGIEPGRVTFKLDVGEHLYNPIGSVHGGVFCALLDSAIGCAVHTTLDRGQAFTTLELNVHLVKALTMTTPRVVATGQVVNVGRRVVTASGQITGPDGTLYAHATTTCLVFERKPGTGIEPSRDGNGNGR